MSTQSITTLMELAAEELDTWTGTLMGRLIEWDLEQKDWESLAQHVREAQALDFQLNYNPNDIF